MHMPGTARVAVPTTGMWATSAQRRSLPDCHTPLHRRRFTSIITPCARAAQMVCPPVLFLCRW